MSLVATIRRCESAHIDATCLRVDSLRETRGAFMEFLLLWADDLDDALGALRHLLREFWVHCGPRPCSPPRVLRLVLAPQLTLAAIAAWSCRAALVETVRRRRAAPGSATPTTPPRADSGASIALHTCPAARRRARGP